MTSLTDKLSE